MVGARSERAVRCGVKQCREALQAAQAVSDCTATPRSADAGGTR
jgi:hypothetical protein